MDEDYWGKVNENMVYDREGWREIMGVGEFTYVARRLDGCIYFFQSLAFVLCKRSCPILFLIPLYKIVIFF